MSSCTGTIWLRSPFFNEWGLERARIISKFWSTCKEFFWEELLLDLFSLYIDWNYEIFFSKLRDFYSSSNDYLEREDFYRAISALKVWLINNDNYFSWISSYIREKVLLIIKETDLSESWILSKWIQKLYCNLKFYVLWIIGLYSDWEETNLNYLRRNIRIKLWDILWRINEIWLGEQIIAYKEVWKLIL